MSFPQFRGQSKPTTFLYRVSHPWHDASPRNELLEQLYVAIRTLPEVDRSLILLSLDGVLYDEMATIHGLSESNVNRIKQGLTQQLNEK